MLKIKQNAVWIALAFTLAAVAWVSQFEESDDVVGVTRNAELSWPDSISTIQSQGLQHKLPAEKYAAKARVDVQRPQINEVPKNIFTAFGASENSAAEHVTAPISMPTNPFTYAGKVVEEGKVTVFLIDGEKSHAVNVGDVIEETWKVKSISPPNMTLRNLPLKIEMQMEIGAIS